MIDAVLFDLDGTLITYRCSYADFMRRIAASWQITHESDPFFAAYSQAIVAEGPVTFKSAIEKALLASGQVHQGNIEEKCRVAVAEYAGGTELLPWALELFANYSSLPKAIVSNGPFDMQLAAVQKYGIEKLVDEVIISGDPEVGIRKPNPLIFHLACARLGIEPSRTLMIGDNEAADVQGARAAGLQAVLVAELINNN